jgi:hypothetical protein
MRIARPAVRTGDPNAIPANRAIRASNCVVRQHQQQAAVPRLEAELVRCFPVMDDWAKASAGNDVVMGVAVRAGLAA